MDTTTVGDLAGQTLGGRYLVERPLARGGMATVYLATDTRLDRTVAVKVLRVDLSEDPEFMARFLREAKATAALSHPHVVSVFDFDVAGNVAYLVLEYVPGYTLRHLLTEYRLTPSQSLAVLEPILEALAAAHEAGIVHRDIKPENVLIGRRGLVKVADFGLARALDDHENRTKTGLVIGTAAYVSPEHVAGTGTSGASDIYSTGILLYEMLVGQPPFTGENSLSVAFQHVHSDVPRPSARRQGLPTELDELVLGATAREPSARFPSAQGFVDELRRVRALMPAADPLPLPVVDSSSTVILTSGPPSPIDLADPPSTAPDASGSEPDALTVGLMDPDDGDDGAGGGAGGDDAAGGVGRRRKRRRKGLFLAAVLTVALVAGLTWAAVAGPLERATVPDLSGLSTTDAESRLAQAELRLEISDREYSETVPKDAIISQRPDAESETFIRFPVSVVVSLGPERYEVPDVRGKTVAEASAALRNTKLAVAEQKQAYDEAVAEGLVTGTEPPAGASLKPQTPVTLVVSKGPAPRPVPEVLGASKADAVAALKAAGLQAATSEEYSEKYPAGTVAAVDPAAGTPVAKGSTVKLTISKGPPPVEVPRVVDMKRSDAVQRLQSVGFRVKVQEGIVTPLDRVYSQDPPPGELLPKGSTVTISIF